MMKKLALAALIFLQLSIVPSWSAETVLIERLTSSEAEELDIQIPATVSPGYHEVIIEISDDNGVLDKKVLTFCKDLDGRIDWASSCPNLISIADEEDLVGLDNRSALPAYDPALEPDKTSDLQVTAYAALAALSAGGAAAAARSGGSQPMGRSEEDDDRDDSSANNDENQGDKEQDDLASVSAGGLLLINRGPGKGDLSSTWRNAGH